MIDITFELHLNPELEDDWLDYYLSPDVPQGKVMPFLEYMQTLDEKGDGPPEQRFFNEYKNIATQLKDLAKVQFFQLR